MILELLALPIDGLHLTYLAKNNMFSLVITHLVTSTQTAVSHKAAVWDLYYLYYTYLDYVM